MMKLNYKSSKTIGIIIGIILFIALIGGITYAVFNWRSTETNISLDTKCFDIQGNSSYTVTGNNSNMLLFDESEVLDTTNHTITYKNGMVYYPFNITRGSECNTDVYYEIIVNVTTLSNDYRNGSLKYKIIEDMSSYTSQQIANPLNEDLTYNTLYAGSITHTGMYSIYSKNSVKNMSVIPAVIFYLDGDLVPGSASNFTFSASIEVVGNQGEYAAAQYITDLYTSASKSTATVNSITYNLAPSLGLMNDRHASMSTDINGGNIRYYGADPNNYVWLGDTYTSSYTFSYMGSNVTRNVGDKKLWRIIGVFDGRIKLVSNDPISTQGLSWDTSASSVNSGSGINQWGPSPADGSGYKGADLMKLLNPGYEDNQDLDSNGDTITVNNSLYWNKGTGAVYTGQNNATTSNVSFANTGLSASEINMIDSVTWYTGAFNSGSYVNNYYNDERGTMGGKICTQGDSYCNDTVTRTSTWNGKVGLIYASDYGYAADLSQCNRTLIQYNNTACYKTNWLYSKRGEWAMFSRASNSTASYLHCVTSQGNVTNGCYAYLNYAVRPTIYLKSGVNISRGNGSQSSPYELSN